MAINPGLAIAGGLGALGLGFLAWKKFGGDDKPEGADPSSKDVQAPTDAAQGAGMVDPTSAQAPMGMDQAAAGAGGIGGLQGRQVGPYTVVDDGTGTQIVFETATQQPVGVLDAQGNMTPITVDAAGNVSLAPTGGTPAPSAGMPGATAPVAGAAAPVPGEPAYADIARQLFSRPADPTVGSAASTPMPGATSSVPTTTTTTSAPAMGGQPTTEQVGEFTIINDGSGTSLVVETATQMPVATMDAAGNLTPLPAGAAAPAGAVAPAPSAATVTPAPTVTSPAMPGATTGAPAGPGALGY